MQLLFWQKSQGTNMSDGLKKAWTKEKIGGKHGNKKCDSVRIFPVLLDK